MGLGTLVLFFPLFDFLLFTFVTFFLFSLCFCFSKFGANVLLNRLDSSTPSLPERLFPPHFLQTESVKLYYVKKARIPRHRHRLARHDYILTSDTRDFLELFLWQSKRHADILATILARMSVSVS